MASIAGFLHPCLGQGSMGQPEGMVKSRQTLGHWYSVYTVSFILHQLYSQMLDDIGMRELETAFLVSSLRDKRTRGAMTFGATKEIDALEAKSHPLHQRKHFQDLLPGSSAQTKQRQRHPMIEADVNKAEFKPN
ncbi:hypothetical protein PSHT_10571, partial [Puccinia striiformis]